MAIALLPPSVLTSYYTAVCAPIALFKSGAPISNLLDDDTLAAPRSASGMITGSSLISSYSSSCSSSSPSFA